DDVHYLLPLWQKLEQQLNVLQRGTWFKSDCVTALAVPPITPPEALWARLRGLRSMQPQQQCAALALVGWRERYAQALDRPRRWIMSDELLLRIARTEPDSVASLKSVPEIPERLADRAGIEIISELRSCDGASQRSLLDTHLMTDRPDKSALQSLQERVQRRAEELGIQTEVLATRKEMSELLVGRPSERIDGGWRHSELQNLLANSQHIE
ncbi:MAG TPA: HRDC domain-containing protein, partial [Gammaproteobacteria bacterium]|nr:HRDC domain-containing protein [Gammaproteobacteria bacterium]